MLSASTLILSAILVNVFSQTPPQNDLIKEEVKKIFVSYKV